MAEDGGSETNDLVSQITAQPSAVEDLTQAILPSLISSLEDLAAKNKETLVPSQGGVQGESSTQNSKLVPRQLVQGENPGGILISTHFTRGWGIPTLTDLTRWEHCMLRTCTLDRQPSPLLPLPRLCRLTSTGQCSPFSLRQC